MKLRFKKGAKGKPSYFTCLRDDGTSTYQALALPVEHDLLHYAVETTMEWREAFLGQIAGGRDLDSFGTKNGVKDTYPLQAISAETTVGMIQWSLLSGTGLSDDELLKMDRQNYEEKGTAPPPLTPEHLAIFRAKWAELRRRSATPEGGTMELTY